MGDSMIGAAIADGDLVVVRQQPAAENGEIVAAQLAGTATAEATVKTLQRLDGHAWLMPTTRPTSRSPLTTPPSWVRWWPLSAQSSEHRADERLTLGPDLGHD